MAAVRKIDPETGNATLCETHRYYFDEEGVLECCDPHCAAGCSGHSPQNCHVSCHVTLLL